MILTDKQIEFISNNLEFYGIHSEHLKEDLLDHICSAIESYDTKDFKIAYHAVLSQFGGYQNIKQIQRDISISIHLKKVLRLKKMLHFMGYLTGTTLITGLLFKIMQWPFASIILLIGFIVLILIVLPLFFYEKHKESILNYQL